MKKLQSLSLLALAVSVSAAQAQVSSVVPNSGTTVPGNGQTIAQDEYMWDDGTTENLLGWTAGGTLAYMQWFDAINGTDTINEVSIINGSAMFPGFGNGNGSQIDVGIWSDPDGDGHPADSVLLTTVQTTVSNIDTDVYQRVAVAPTVVTGRFFIGAWITHNAGQFIAPMDQNSQPVANRAYVFGEIANSGGNFNPNNPSDPGNTGGILEMSSIGFPTDFCVRASSGGGGGFNLAVSMSQGCPGPITVSWNGSPGTGQQALVIGNNLGSTTIPNNPCAGTILGIQGQVQMVDPPGFFSNGGGSGSINGTVRSAGVCGKYLQLVKGGTCETSTVAQIQ